MKKMLFTIALIFVAISTHGQLFSDPNGRYLQTNGEAELEITPDEIFVKIIINGSEVKNKGSVEQMEQKMVEALRDIGVDVDNDLRVGDMSVAERKRFFGNSIGNITIAYQLKANGGEELGRIYQTLRQIGITQMGITRLSHSKANEFEDELRVKAVKRAQHNASVMAEAAGVKLGKLKSLDNFMSPYIMEITRMDDSRFIDETFEPVSFRKIKLSFEVSIVYEIE